MRASSDFTRFEIPDIATFAIHPGGLPRLCIRTAQSHGELFLHGAHVTRFQPAGAKPVLFLSQHSHFASDKAIRGGVPVCFPWFGPRAGDPAAPMHGFARTRAWDLESLEGSAEHGVTVAMRLTSSDATRALWPHDFSARFVAEFTSHLSMTLEIENTSDTPFQFEEALHSYFAVSDVRQVNVTGLESAAYLDKTDAFTRKHLGAEPLRFTSETDRIFPEASGPCVIHDPALERDIDIGQRGASTTVVWNPWSAKAAALPDFGDDEWPRMLCIETANTGDGAITLAPGAKHALTQIVVLGV